MLEDVLGLSPEEVRAYRGLIAVPSTSREELAEQITATPEETARLLASLERQGLASLNGGEAGRYVAAPPALALGALLVRRQNEIKMAELELSSIEEIYRASSARRGAADVVDVVHGAAAVAQRIEQLQLGAREEVLAFVKPPTAVVSAAQNQAEDQAVSRGVRYRVLLDRTALDTADSVEQAKLAVGAGEEVRVIADVPLKLIIVDRELAIMQMAPRADVGDPGALLVRESALLDALLALFDSVWAQAIPVVTSTGDLSEATAQVIDEVDARVLGLLLLGFTDQAVANQLDTSIRTVQRRVRHLMNLARVETRLQLGWQAARLGWV